MGDHIEKVVWWVEKRFEKSLVGCSHFEAMKIMKEIPKGAMFLLRLVEPQKAELGKET